MRKKIRKSEEEIKEEIMQMSPIEIKIETKYIIYFEDHGQDFLEWHIDKNGYVLDSRPFQRRIWTGKFTIPQSAQVGEKLAIWQNGESWVNYPIKEIKIINKNDVKSATNEGEKNPAHFCECGKFLGHRGFCSDECHNKHYDAKSGGNEK